MSRKSKSKRSKSKVSKKSMSKESKSKMSKMQMHVISLIARHTSHTVYALTRLRKIGTIRK